MNTILTRLWMGAILGALTVQFVAGAEIKDLSINGGVQDGKARLIIEALLQGMPEDAGKLLFASSIEHVLRVSTDEMTHRFVASIDILQGDPKELPFTLDGEGTISSVTGELLQDWSVRQETNNVRTLVLRPRKTAGAPLSQLTVTITAQQERKAGTGPVRPLTLTPPRPALFHGYVKVEHAAELDVQPEDAAGLVPIEVKTLPASMRAGSDADDPEPRAYRFHGAAYALPLRVVIADPEARRVVLREFKLEGRLSEASADFTLTATARVKNPKGGVVNLLSGGVALTRLESQPGWRLRFDNGQFVARFDRAGEFPIRLEFNAAVRRSDGWNGLDFRVAPGVVMPAALQGLAADTQFQFPGAARPERSVNGFDLFLPSDGAVKLSWKEAHAEAEGRLFYSVEMLSQISLSPGLMRQAALVEGRVMQGELTRLAFELHGQGSVTRVAGPNVLSWSVEPAAGGGATADRRVLVQFNQPQKESFSLQVQMQSELGAFPLAVEAMRLRPEGATRFAGHIRVVNEGAVRLEVLEAAGLSQISPEQFPESDATKALFGGAAGQRFAFRFAGVDLTLRIQADNVLPELSVSQVLAYHLGESELAIEAELELDIREAPAREVVLRIPTGYAIARLNATGLSDYFTGELPGEPDTALRLVYGQPVMGRQVLQLRLERNAALGETAWNLPRIEVIKAKATRGHVGVSADPGFRLVPERAQGLTDIATAYFPKKLAGIQAAFRLSDPVWRATMRVERLPQSIQAEVFHLFSIGEGIGYGSSTIHYLVSGAPVSQFQVEVSKEYFNVEFTGKDIRHWQQTTNGYLVQLHTPVSGAYTLLATYERPFKSQGDTLTFTGARPSDASAEQGHTLVISAFQFQVKPVNVSAGLMALETAEVPDEYRLFFDAPILAAYRYTTRPFNLQLALSPLSQAETLRLVVDRATLSTRISKDGEVVTHARYYIKSRGHTHFPLTAPEGTELWSVTVNGMTVVPVKDGAASLIPFPQHADPNAVHVLDAQIASRSANPSRLRVAAPVLGAPVLLAEWRLAPDTGQRLMYRRGSLAPTDGRSEVSGFAVLASLLSGQAGGPLRSRFLAAVALTGLAVWAWRWATREGTTRFSLRHLAGGVLGLAAFGVAMGAFLTVGAHLSGGGSVAKELVFVAPVQQSGSALHVDIANVAEGLTLGTVLGWLWPVGLAFVIWLYGLVSGRRWLRPVVSLLGWTVLAWAALRWPNGALPFFALIITFALLYVALPALRRFRQLPARQGSSPEPESSPATAAWIVGGLIALSAGGVAQAAPATGTRTAARAAVPVPDPVLAESVLQTLRVEEEYGFAKAKIHWQATKDALLPFLFEPAVLTRIVHPAKSTKHIQLILNSQRAHHLLALEDGIFDIEAEFQIQVTRKDGETGFVLPTHQGLVNHLTLTLTGLDVDIVSPQAVSVERRAEGSNTVARLVLAPARQTWIGWKPRLRDARQEKAVYYADWLQLYAPAAGVIEGAHFAQIRPAQGEVSELIFEVPKGLTIIDVADATASDATPESAPPAQNAAVAQALPAVVSRVALWRFDPESGQLRVTLHPPPSRPFSLLIRSQAQSGALPVEQSLGLLALRGAAGQVGSLAIATGSEVQLDAVNAEGFSVLNLEDFPVSVLQPLATSMPGLGVRRAFRYTDMKGTVVMKASGVEPDVRLETQETLSLGEDRTVLAANWGVSITRAGIFRLSFVLPTGLDVEAISGPALSHWTELKTADQRVVTLHLKGKTEGQTQLAISLSGPGAKPATNWAVPRLIVREASKQRGQLAIVPEQGLRLQPGAREGVTQLDPQKAGIRQKGVLVFRVLQQPWQLTLDIEPVEAWVQVTGLQHATVTEAQVKVLANLQYQIDNTGLKSFRLRIPTNAESVRFAGDQVADFLPSGEPGSDGLRIWEVKLHRRVLGKYLLQASYQTPVEPAAAGTTLDGVQALDVNQQRGFVTVASAGRLRVHANAVPAALQPAEWQAIPRTLLQDLTTAPANHAFRLVEPAFRLPLQLERHEAARLLPAHVQSVTLTSVISDEGVMLTEARLEMRPGDKRLLHFTLPKDARFWFAFVNQNGVWPWRDQDRILIPLEQPSRSDKPLVVELFYSSLVGAARTRTANLALQGPKFDLPLENITWHVYLNDRWQLADWKGSLQLQEEGVSALPGMVDVQSYLQSEASFKRGVTQEAEQLLAMGNSLLEQGNPQQARRAFQSAYSLSTHDDAFNEDARVQLHNLKLQQALVGLNARQSAVAGETTNAAVGGLRARKDAAYTQQEAKQILDANTAEDNAALTRLAERLIQQQDAAVPTPAALRAAIPQQGREYTFRRAVQVDTFADLKLDLETTAIQTASAGVRLGLLTGVFFALALAGWVARRALAAPK